MKPIPALPALNNAVYTPSQTTSRENQAIYAGRISVIAFLFLVIYPHQDFVYDSSSILWACCYGSGTDNCFNPSTETFEAPSSQQLNTCKSIVYTNPNFIIRFKSSVFRFDSLPHKLSHDIILEQVELSPQLGGIAGIAIAVAAVGGLLVAAVLFFLFRGPRRKIAGSRGTQLAVGEKTYKNT